MGALVALLSALNTLSPLAIVALLGLVLLLQARNQKVAVANQTAVLEVKDNHLHDLPQIGDNINKMVETLQRIEVAQSENFAYIRARLNGGSHAQH